MILSIIIPAYNSETFIEQCVRNIVAEIDDNVEVIIIDDGSTDATLDKCRKIESANLRVIHQQNGGVSSARNKGIESALGKYIMFVDADDILLPRWYGKVGQYLSETYDIIYFGKDYTRDYYSKAEILEKTFGLPKSTIQGNLSSVCSKVYLRTYINKHNIRFDTHIINGEDLLFSLKAALTTDNYRFVKAAIYEYMLNPTSATHTFKDEYIESNRRFIVEAEHLLNLNGISSEFTRRYLKFSFINGLVIFIARLSYLAPHIREKKIKLLETPYITQGLKNIKLKITEFGLAYYIVYKLISLGMINTVVWIVARKIQLGRQKIKSVTI